MRRKLYLRWRTAWRRFRGRCTICNAKRGPRRALDLFSNHPEFCRRCTRVLTFARLFGAGPAGVARILKEGTCLAPPSSSVPSPRS